MIQSLFLKYKHIIWVIQKVVERHEIWYVSKKAILKCIRYDSKSKSMVDIREIKHGISETIPAFIY